ncbi:MAG: tetratricopeptide repeat protein [Clostridia bacterium]|nr:tetratricopeptide repeat protein [Clostridia bacterium]
MGKENYNGERKIEKLDFQYKLQFVVIGLSIIICTILICITLALKNEVENLRQQNIILIEQTKSLDENAKLLLEDNASDESIEVYNQNANGQGLIFTEEPTSLKDAVELMDDRYDDFTNNWSTILMVTAAGLGLLVIIFPFFNYVFLQKDAVKIYEKKMNKLHNKKEKEMNSIISEFERKYQEDENVLRTAHKKMQDEIDLSLQNGKNANVEIEKAQGKLKQARQGIDSKIGEWEERINKYIEEGKKQIDKRVELANKTIDMANQYIESASNPDENRKPKDINVEFEEAKDRARVYFLNGNIALDKKDYSKAIENYNRAIELDDANYGAYYNRGYSYAQKKNPNYDNVISDYNKAIELDPDYAIAYINRGNAYAIKENPDYEKAIEDYNKAVELDPDYAIVYSNRGNAYAIKDNPDYEKAIKDYTKAIELDPSYAIAYNNRGDAYTEKENPDYEKAIKDYTRAIELDPSYAIAYNNRGTAYSKKDNPDYEKVIKDYTKAIDLNRSYILAYNNRGTAYSKKDNPDYEKALNDYKSSIEIDSNFAGAYNNLACVYLELSKKENKEENLEIANINIQKAIELDDTEGLFYCTLAEYYYELGEEYKDKQKEAYERAIALDMKCALGCNKCRFQKS